MKQTQKLLNWVYLNNISQLNESNAIWELKLKFFQYLLGTVHHRALVDPSDSGGSGEIPGIMATGSLLYLALTGVW